MNPAIQLAIGCGLLALVSACFCWTYARVAVFQLRLKETAKRLSEEAEQLGVAGDPAVAEMHSRILMMASVAKEYSLPMLLFVMMGDVEPSSDIEPQSPDARRLVDRYMNRSVLMFYVYIMYGTGTGLLATSVVKSLRLGNAFKRKVLAIADAMVVPGREET